MLIGQISARWVAEILDLNSLALSGKFKQILKTDENKVTGVIRPKVTPQAVAPLHLLLIPEYVNNPIVFCVLFFKTFEYQTTWL